MLVNFRICEARHRATHMVGYSITQGRILHQILGREPSIRPWSDEAFEESAKQHLVGPSQNPHVSLKTSQPTYAWFNTGPRWSLICPNVASCHLPLRNTLQKLALKERLPTALGLFTLVSYRYPFSAPGTSSTRGNSRFQTLSLTTAPTNG